MEEISADFWMLYIISGIRAEAFLTVIPSLLLDDNECRVSVGGESTSRRQTPSLKYLMRQAHMTSLQGDGRGSLYGQDSYYKGELNTQNNGVRLLVHGLVKFQCAVA